MPLELHRLTREYLWWKITTTNDLTTSSAELAFTPSVEIPASWIDATVDLVQVDNVWYIRHLVSGPGNGGDTELEEGDHQVWARITDIPERIVRKVGVVTIL